jgi:hypothetical protein
VARFLSERIDCDQFLAVQAAYQADAAVNGFVSDVALLAGGSGNDGAGATVTGGAALLGAGESHFGAQPLENAQIWVDLVNFFVSTVQKEFDHGSLRLQAICGVLRLPVFTIDRLSAAYGPVSAKF